MSILDPHKVLEGSTLSYQRALSNGRKVVGTHTEIHDLEESCLERTPFEGLLGVPELRLDVGSDDDSLPKGVGEGALDVQSLGVPVEDLEKIRVRDLFRSAELVDDEPILTIVPIPPDGPGLPEVEGKRGGHDLVRLPSLARTGRTPKDPGAYVAPGPSLLLKEDSPCVLPSAAMAGEHAGELVQKLVETVAGGHEVTSALV